MATEVWQTLGGGAEHFFDYPLTFSRMLVIWLALALAVYSLIKGRLVLAACAFCVSLFYFDSTVLDESLQRLKPEQLEGVMRLLNNLGVSGILGWAYVTERKRERG